MKQLHRTCILFTILLATAGTACSPSEEIRNNRQYALTVAKQEAVRTGYSSYAVQPRLKEEESWEDFKEKAVFSIRYNELRIMELKNYLKKNAHPEDSFYQLNINTLADRNLSLKTRLNAFNKYRDNMTIFKLGFNYDMEMLIKELKDFSIYNL
jgi:hypothetical protein